MTEPVPDMLAAALQWHDAGCSVVRVTTNGSKTPLGTWKTNQVKRADRTHLHTWFQDNHPGLGIVCGTVSAHLELLEFEGRAVAENLVSTFTQSCVETGISDTWKALNTGCVVMSPSGGLHLYYRVTDGVDGNTKLAQRYATDDELTQDEKDRLTDKGLRATRVLIETRGEGGFVVAAPSHGSVHDTGKPWKFIFGGPATIPTITATQRDTIHIIARGLDQLPAPDPIPEPTILDADRTNGGNSPGTDYNERGSWQQLLEPHGWRLVSAMSTPDRQYWTRPGKTHGVSAVTGGDNDYFWCWSSSTELPTEAAMSKWRVYALLEHGGDFHAAAKELKRRGYGQSTPPTPRPVFHILGGLGPTTTDGTSAHAPQPTTAVAPTIYEPHDDGNALRLIDTHGHQLRYSPERGAWLHWTGHVWRWDLDDLEVRELARGIARDLPHNDPPQNTHRRTSLSATGISSMIRVARSDPRIRVKLSELDADPWLLNTPIGVINLRTGQLTQANSAVLVTRSTTIAPSFNTPHPRWDTFINETFGGDKSVAEYVQRLIGLSLVGEVREPVLPFGYGAGANGKTTLLSVAQKLLGVDETGYAIPVPVELLLAGQGESHPTLLAQLVGVRLAVASEPSAGQRFDEGRVKLLTGGDLVRARFMRQDFFSFRPSHTLWLLANDQPGVRVGGPAFWRRVRLLSFPHVVPPEQRISALDDVLIAEEGPAILAWMIRGAAAYATGGLKEPDSITEATSGYAASEDSVQRFITENCTTGTVGSPGMSVTTTNLRTSYETFCRDEGMEPVPVKRFLADMRDRFNVEITRSNGKRWARGIRLNIPLNTEEDQI